MGKRIILGDKFLSWEVLKASNNRKYYYDCVCSCGVVKQISKYALLNGTFSACNNCGYNYITNVADISTYWNSELNNSYFSNISDFNLNKSYWFTCSNGHNFKSKLRNFNLSDCFNCKNKDKIDTITQDTLEYVCNVLQGLCIGYKVQEPYSLVEIPSERVILHLKRSDRYDVVSRYFKNEFDYINEIEFIKKYKNNMTNNGYTIIEASLNSNLLKTIDNIEHLMLELLHC